MASSAKSLSSSAPAPAPAPAAAAVVVVVAETEEVVVDFFCAAGTAILMPESPVQGDARKLSRGGEEEEAAPSEPEPGEQGL